MSENQTQSSSPIGAVNLILGQPPRRNLTGMKFGRLTVVRYAGKAWSHYWECVCECGNTTLVAGSNLLRKARPSGSCGCVRIERAKVVNIARLTSHGMRFTRTYRCWAGMKTRATNPNATRANRYSGRGIGIAERWKTFENFLSDMGECPSVNHSIDRWPNNDGNYEPGNCRWATRIEQVRNTSANVMLTFHGETCCLTEMAERHGLNPVVLQARITQLGWDVETAITKPTRQS